MSLTETDFMPNARQLFPRRMAEALAALISQKHGTAKQIARAYRIDPATAENLRKGHLSVTTLEKVVQAEGWGLWAALGQELTGVSYADHLQSVIDRENYVQEQRASIRDAARLLEARSFDGGAIHDRADA